MSADDGAAATEEAAPILVDDTPPPQADAAFAPSPRTARHYVGLLATAGGLAAAAACAAAGSAPFAAGAVVLALLVGTLVRGPVDGVLSGVLPLLRPCVKIGGRCAAGPRTSSASFASTSAAARSAYVRGERVVDLWGVNIFSSTKVMTSLVVAMLADRQAAALRPEDQRDLARVWRARQGGYHRRGAHEARGRPAELRCAR